MSRTRRNRKCTPSIRFKEFTEPWMVIKAEALFGNRRETSNKRDLNIYSVTLENGLVPRNSLQRRMKDDSENNLVAKESDIVYNMMRMWQGAMGIASCECIVSPAYVVLSPKRNTFSLFYLNLLKTRKYLHILRSYSYGLTEDRLRLYYKDFSKIQLPFTSIDEQKKIASFFELIDLRIQQLIKKKELLEQYKKGVMQKIFTQRIRFEDEKGESYPKWEKSTLGQISTIIKGKGISRSDIVEGGRCECIRYGELYTHYKERITEIFSRTNVDKDGLLLSEVNDVVIPSSGETKVDIAKASCVLKSGVALGGDMNVLKTKQNGIFLAYYINNALKFEIAKLAQGNSVVHLYPNQLEIVKLKLPCVAEQHRIANFLSHLDDQVDRVSREVELVRSFKKSLLQQMFI